ncbi:DUF6575 domain-containing protein [Iodobacter arcticus]
MSHSNYLKSLISDLTPIEIFDYYDGPKFYSCRDKAGQLFLVYWIDETTESTAWLYLRISQERYNSLKSGNLAIARALAQPEEGLAFVVTSMSTDFQVQEVSVEEISIEWLPPETDFLEIPTQALPEKMASAQEIASRTNRQVIDIAFDKLSNAYEMGAGKLGQLLHSLQNVIYALACDEKMDVRRVPEEIKYKSEVLVTGLFASSFGVRLQSKGGDIFGTDETARAVESLVKLIATLEVPESVPKELHRFNVLARSRFKHFLRVIVDSQVSIKTEWGTPNGRGLNSTASFHEILQALNMLEETDDATKTTVNRNAELVGVDVESDFFAIKVENNEIIKGRLSKPVSNRHFDVPSRIIATLEESCIIDPLTDREKWSYTLIDFKRADGKV